jgi:hypothetical protein
MMNGRGESDSAIVAGKPTNKAERSAAEPAEPRAEAKGNAGQQSTRRAQNRVSVSQALERIRQTARQRKKEKFTALFHHVSIDHLEEAFFELKENAAPGVDGLTCRDHNWRPAASCGETRCQSTLPEAMKDGVSEVILRPNKLTFWIGCASSRSPRC